MGIQTNNSNATSNTLTSAINIVHTLAITLSKSFDYENVWTATKSEITLEKNLVMEIHNGRRGGANRLRVYLNKRNGLYAVSVRYGNNIAYHDEVIDACKGYTLERNGKAYAVDFSNNMQVTAVDGKSESRIQFMVSRFDDFVLLVQKVVTLANIDNTVEAVSDASVTA